MVFSQLYLVTSHLECVSEHFHVRSSVLIDNVPIKNDGFLFLLHLLLGLVTHQSMQTCCCIAISLRTIMTFLPSFVIEAVSVACLALLFLGMAAAFEGGLMSGIWCK